MHQAARICKISKLGYFNKKKNIRKYQKAKNLLNITFQNQICILHTIRALFMIYTQDLHVITNSLFYILFPDLNSSFTDSVRFY